VDSGHNITKGGFRITKSGFKVKKGAFRLISGRLPNKSNIAYESKTVSSHLSNTRDPVDNLEEMY
jgi:hypothetical protein